ncbi:MAG: hypothetical protein HKN17_09485, partial [Rhodothermales bacterium]|nr:hypothetical protein [Rhodothermales bacterium]
VFGPVFDIGLHPQFYTYSTVFGGVLGPIYDEELVLRPGLFLHRIVTIAWGVFFFASRERFNQWSLLLVLALGCAYVYSGRLGLNTPLGYLRSTFEGHLRTEHFDIHFDPAATDSLELVRMAEEHEYRYARLRSALGVDVDDRISTFIYPDAETRAKRTGARVTSVAPVWLRTPQIHVERASFYDVFPHELVHVFSREFGLPVLNASMHVGLVEGLAVALEPPDGGPSPDEQVAAAAWARLRDGAEAFSVAARMSNALSPAGFWGSRGAVSYTMTGSFVGFLLDTYGPAPFRSAYPTGTFDAAYAADLSTLARRWEADLKSMPVMCRTAGPEAGRRFSVPSLFERRCPHWVPPELKELRRAVAAARDGRPEDARSLLSDLPDDVRAWPSVRVFEAGLLLERDPEAALRLVGDSLAATSPNAAALAGDALALMGRPSMARRFYADAISLESPTDRAVRTSRIVRFVLADRPDAVRAVRSAGGGASGGMSSGARLPFLIDLHGLESEARAAASLANALILYRDGHYEDALDYLGIASNGDGSLWPTGEARRFALRLEALAAYRAGVLDVAGERARTAATRFAEAGDASMAAAMDDLVKRIEWRESM